MTSHPVNPAVVDRLTNHSNARLEPLDTLMNDNSENAACIHNMVDHQHHQSSEELEQANN